MGWFNREPEKEIPIITDAFIAAMVKEAQRQGLWLVVGKKWIEPTKFREYCRQFCWDVINNKYNLPENYVKLKNPVEVIPKWREKLDNEEHQLLDFSLRVAKYFQDHSQKK